MKGGSLEQPGKESGSAQQEARTCPVCGTKFYAAGDSRFWSRLYPAGSYWRGIYSDRGTGFSIWVSR